MKKIKWRNGWTLTIMEKWETLNPNWRPRKGISLVINELKKKWYEPAKKSDIIETYLSIIQLEEKEMFLLAKDETKPMVVRILAKNIISKKWFDIIEKMLDRSLGKPTQEIDNNHKGLENITIKLPNND